MELHKSIYVHPTALVDTEDIGENTRIWANAHIREAARVGKDCNICDYVMVDGHVGDRVTLKEYSAIALGFTIEDDVFVGPQVMTANDRQPRSPRMKEVPEIAERYSKEENWLVKSRICKGAAIGASVFIAPGVTVGSYAMVAAGTVLTKNVPAYRLVAGNGRPVGWMCRCGARLGELQETHWGCIDCERKYLLDAQDGMQFLNTKNK